MIRFLAAFAASLLLAFPAAAANRASVATGNWNQAGPTIWSTVCGGAAGSSVPNAGDDVTICNATTVTVSAAQAANTVIISAGGTLTFSGANTLTIDNSPPLTLNGGTFTAGSGKVIVNRDQAATVPIVSGTSASITFNNLEISPAIGAAGRTYTLGAGSITSITVNGDFDIVPANAAGAARSLDVARGTVTSFTVGGRTRVVALGAGNDSTSFTATGLTSLTSGTVVLGDAAGGTGANTLTAGAVPITLNGAAGPLLTRNANGVFARGTSTVTINSAASVALTSGTFTGTNAFYNLTVSMPGQTGSLGAAIDLTGAAGLGGDLTLTAGTLADNGNAITSIAGGARTLSATANGGLTLGTAATATAFPTSFTTISLNAASTVTYNSDAAQAISATPVYGNLVLAATAAVVKTPSAGLNIDGSLTIGANNTLAGGALSHTLAGNFTNNGVFTTTGTLTLDGAAAQTIGGTTNTTFNNLTIANTVGGVSLTSSQTVGAVGAGTLTLTSGAFSVGANTLTLDGPTIAGTPTNLSTTAASSLVFGGNAAGINLPSSVTNLSNLTLNNTNATPQLTLNSSPTLAGTLTLTNGVIVTGTNTLDTTASCPGSVARTSGWVSGNLRMAFPAGTPNCTFHVGDAATNYTPLQLNFSSVTTAGSLTAATTSTDHPNTTAGTSGISSGVSVNRYWVLRDSTMAGTATVTFNYIGGIPVDNDTVATPTRIRRATNCSGTGSTRTCAPWLPLTVSGSPTSTQAVASGVAIAVGATAQSDLAVGGSDPSTNFLRERQFIYTRELY